MWFNKETFGTKDTPEHDQVIMTTCGITQESHTVLLMGITQVSQ
jgi:hypothetical protein